MLHRYVIYMQELQVLCRELKEDKLNLQAYKALLCIAQLFDGEKRGKFPAVTRHLQTLLWHPRRYPCCTRSCSRRKRRCLPPSRAPTAGAMAQAP